MDGFAARIELVQYPKKKPLASLQWADLHLLPSGAGEFIGIAAFFGDAEEAGLFEALANGGSFEADVVAPEEVVIGAEGFGILGF